MDPKRWNIFARTLEDILTQHGYRLGHLDDRVGIHPTTVSRLQHSLMQPTTYPTLNPDDLEAVIYTFQLDESEQYRLYAATIAAAVQEELKKRTGDAENAYIAAEQIFPILYDAFLQHQTTSTGLATFRSDD